jgi:hypothetical protein
MFNRKPNPMKKNLFSALSLTSLILLTLSCNKDKEKECNLVLGPGRPAGAMSVVYSAAQTGDGVITSLTYNTSATDQVTVNNLTLPWSVTVNMSAGSTIQMTATGTAEDGSVIIYFKGNGAGEYLADSTNCSQSN